MSAIFGVWKKNHAPLAPALEAIENALCEWRCDTRATWHAEKIGVGARVLYTTPESQHERIPFTHPAFPHLVLVADAWLDNRAELCDIFQISHSERATICDSELILRAYVKWGDACADKLRGEFAFALWDAPRERWYCARDLMGFKPLFYFDSPQLFCFASDVRGVLACPGVPQTLDEGMLATYLVASTTTAEKRRTFYQNIFKIPPAHFLVVTRPAAQLARYWHPDDAPTVSLPTRDAYAERTRELLERAVADATRTNFRVGAHLSGGLDSTTVAVLAARQVRMRGEMLHGYSWSPSPHRRNMADEDERAFIEMVCAQEHITPRYLEYTVDDAIKIQTRDMTRVPREMALREEQVQEASARENIRIMLSGWGGDELLSYSGRGYLPDLLRRGEWGKLRAEMARRIPKNFRGAERARAYGSLFRRQMVWFLLPDFIWAIHSPYGGRRIQTKYIRPEFFRQQRAAIESLRDPLARDFPNVRVTQSVRLEHGHLSRRMESWATHGAKRGIVYRYPLLTREIVEYALGLPPELYYDAGFSRAVLRNGTRGILPETMRATRTKAEPLAIGIVGDILSHATYALYEQTRPRFANHPATGYINVAALQAETNARKLAWTRSAPFLSALSCFYLQLEPGESLWEK